MLYISGVPLGSVKTTDYVKFTLGTRDTLYADDMLLFKPEDYV